MVFRRSVIEPVTQEFIPLNKRCDHDEVWKVKSDIGYKKNWLSSTQLCTNPKQNFEQVVKKTRSKHIQRARSIDVANQEFETSFHSFEAREEMIIVGLAESTKDHAIELLAKLKVGMDELQKIVNIGWVEAFCVTLFVLKTKLNTFFGMFLSVCGLMFLSDDRVDYMDQSSVGLAFQGVLRPSFVEEIYVINIYFPVVKRSTWGKDIESEENAYNHNFKGKCCTCGRLYPDPDAKEQVGMIQCCICEDWFHKEHLGHESTNDEGEPLYEHAATPSKEKEVASVPSASGSSSELGDGTSEISDADPVVVPDGNSKSSHDDKDVILDENSEDSIAEYEKMAKQKRNEKMQQQEGAELNFLSNLGHELIEKADGFAGVFLEHNYEIVMKNYTVYAEAFLQNIYGFDGVAFFILGSQLGPFMREECHGPGAGSSSKATETQSDKQRHAIKDAGTLVALNVMRLISKPTTAKLLM
ncbi:putative E3 ubiquitin-protein ligase UBR7 [Tanacetum coccineum]